jgi:hypothetical protein
LWEEQILLVEAASESDAVVLAEELGRAKEHAYFVDVPERHQLHWSFERVDRVCAVDGALETGCELFSRFLREREVQSLAEPFDEDVGSV